MFKDAETEGIILKRLFNFNKSIRSNKQFCEAFRNVNVLKVMSLDEAIKNVDDDLKEEVKERILNCLKECRRR